jgi:hypothetical protein
MSQAATELLDAAMALPGAHRLELAEALNDRVHVRMLRLAHDQCASYGPRAAGRVQTRH